MDAFDEKLFREQDYVSLVADSIGQDYQTVYKFMWDENERRQKLKNTKIFLVQSGRTRKIFRISKIPV